MNGGVALTDVERFRGTIASRLGLNFDEEKLDFLGDVLRRRVDATGQECGSYLRSIDIENDGELGALAGELTVAETYFFRNIEQFHSFAELVVPERMKAREPGRQLRILSAGCATGEEAYTLAMVLRDALYPGWSASVLAVDLNPSVLRRARSGRFSSWSLRETPGEEQQRWFRKDARDVVLDDSIRAAVTFEQRNLAADNLDLWKNDSFDVVFCRNVMMYFTPDGARELVNRITRALAPGGVLYLGHAETLRGLSQAFHLRHTHGTFYYQRKAEIPSAASAAAEGFIGSGSLSAVPVPNADAGTWVDAIRMASERVARLVDATPARPPRALEAPTDRGRWDLGAALELLRAERFGEALDLVEALPSDASDDADVLLLQSVLLTHAGLLDRAEATCRRLLEIDDLSAGAHYVLALCREGTGDPAGAADHDRMAAHLDPWFAMPRLHLGMLARRARDVPAMCREFRHASSLLEREDASRLLLFGGGFGRKALIALCRSEILGGEAAS